MPASFDSLLTAAQNIAQAINGVSKTYTDVQGAQNYPEITGGAPVLVKTGNGRIAMISVTTAGAVGAVYDTNDATLTNRQIYAIPATIGAFFVNLPFSYGLVVAPGAGQIVTVSWS